jgi:hypothetical protein
MTQVTSTTNFTDKIFFKELDNIKKKAFFILEGVGSDYGIDYIEDDLSNKSIFSRTYDNDNSVYYYIPYISKGEINDIFTLKDDVNTLTNKSFLEPIKNRKERLNNIFKIIKSVILKNNFDENNFDEYILIGMSHGTLIMYSVLLKLEVDIEISHDLLKKLRFYPISPPLILPNNLLSYSSDSNENPLRPIDTSLPPSGTSEIPTPPYLQFQYDDDFWYNTNISLGSGVKLKIIAFLGRNIILKKIINYYNKYKESPLYKNFKDDDKIDKDIRTINEHIDSLPELIKNSRANRNYNELFIYDQNRKMVMEHNLENKGYIYKIYSQSTQSTKTPFDYYYINNAESRYLYAILNLKVKDHANAIFLFPILIGFNMKSTILNINFDLKHQGSRVEHSKLGETKIQRPPPIGGGADPDKTKSLVLHHYSKIIDKTCKSNDCTLIDENIVTQLNTYLNICFPEDKTNLNDFFIRLVTFLHNELESSEDTPPHKRKFVKKPRLISKFNTVFRKVILDLVYDQRNRWELFVLKQDQKVLASCFVHFNDTSKICEIHEVCVGVSGQGYCKILIKSVIDYILDKSLDIKIEEFPKNNNSKSKNKKIHIITIFCETGNIAACVCYTKVFEFYKNEKNITIKPPNPVEIKLDKHITKFTIIINKLPSK